MSESNRPAVMDATTLSSLPEDADLVGMRCEVIFPITNQPWQGKVIRNEGNRQFTWVSDDNKLACNISYSGQFREWVANLFINLEGLSKVYFT